jgi:tRNA modification GTPase
MFNNVQTNLKNTIYSPASPIQKSGIIVIRISGPDMQKVLHSLGCTALTPREATLQSIYHPNTKELIDKCISIYYKSPRSFTGEDVLELHIHGGKAVLDLTMDALSKIQNLRVADPGEFSMRAFLNNKMDLTEVEGLQDLIDSDTKAQHKQALKKLSGELSLIYENWRKSLLHILTRVEASIDFPDEEIPADVLKNTDLKIKEIIDGINLYLENSKKGEKLSEGLYIAILGPTNAGKSSLINKISKKDLAIVSSIEGTTRDIIEIDLDIAGYPVTIADTAGLRESENEIENEGIRRSIEKAKTADLKIIMLDGSKDFIKEESIKLAGENDLIVVNKQDLITAELPLKLGNNKVLPISIKENKGIDLLMSEITNFTKDFFANTDNTPIITKQRHRENLSKALECLQNTDLDADIVLASEELRSAANYLASITGRIDVESLLGEIFSSFCIGK